MIDPAVDLVLRLALAALLLGGGVAKLRDRAAFRRAIEGHDLLPSYALGFASIAFALAELGLGAALAHSALRGGGDLALAGATVLFTVYGAVIVWNLARGRREIDCGCGGAAHLPVSGWLVARNGVLVVAAVVCTTGTTGRTLGWIDAATIAAGVAVLALLWSAVHGLLAFAGELARLQEDV